MSEFNKILEKYRRNSFSERDKGAKFENLMKRFLQVTPLYCKFTMDGILCDHLFQSTSWTATYDQIPELVENCTCWYLCFYLLKELSCRNKNVHFPRFFPFEYFFF